MAAAAASRSTDLSHQNNMQYIITAGPAQHWIVVYDTTLPFATNSHDGEYSYTRNVLQWFHHDFGMVSYPDHRY